MVSNAKCCLMLAVELSKLLCVCVLSFQNDGNCELSPRLYVVICEMSLQTTQPKVIHDYDSKSAFLYDI